MKEFLRYVVLVLKRCFNGLFWLFGAFGTILFGLSIVLPTRVPWGASICVFLLELFYSCYHVWKDEHTNSRNLAIQIAELKDSVPKFKVTSSAITRFTVQLLIDNTTAEVEKLKPAQRTSRGLDPISGLSSTFQALSMQSPVSAAFGGESDADKFKRLSGFLKELGSYDEKLKHIYRVNLEITASRRATDIVGHLTAEAPADIHLRDDDVKLDIPTSEEPSTFGSEYVPAISSRDFAINPDRIYLVTFAKGEKASTKIRSLNSQTPIPLFGDEFYIETTNDPIKMEIIVQSAERIDPQKLHVSLNTSGSKVEEINDNWDL